MVACDRLQGNMPRIGLVRRLYWRTFISASWFTGLRLSDVLSIERQWVGRDGKFTVVQQKTGRSLERQLPLAVLAEIDEMRGAGPGRIWPLWQRTERELFREFQTLVALAGLRGTIKWLRRGGASEVERLQPGAGMRHLGHKTGGLFERCYRVDAIVRRDVPMPPGIS